MLEILVMFMVFAILAIGLVGMVIFATTVRMDYKAHDGSYLVKK